MATDVRRRNHDGSDDAFDALARYGDRAHDLYNNGLAHAADLYHHGRVQAEDTYGRGRRRAGDIYGESRHRLSGAADALAGRRTANRGPAASAATLGVLAGAALVVGALWLLRRARPMSVPAVEPVGDEFDELFADDGAVTDTPVVVTTR